LHAPIKLARMNRNAELPPPSDDHSPARLLRVCVVTETYPPEINGVAMSVARVVEGLRARGHAVQLVRPRQDEGAAEDAAAQADQVFTGAWPLPRYPGLRMGVPCTRRLQRLWSVARPDVVHIATEGPLGWSALRAARRLQVPVTSDFRTNFHAYSRHYGAGWLAGVALALLRRFHNRAACTMVPTPEMRTALAARGFQRLHVVGRGVDPQRFHPARRSAALRAVWGAGDGTLVAVYVGRLAPEKNLRLLPQVHAALRARHADTRLLLVGEGPMLDELRSLCPDAVFAGRRGGEDLAAHYASADLFLFPSLSETFGNVTTEAMASALPVVAFDHAAAGQHIVCGRNGVLARSDSPEAFVHAAASLASDAARRRALGAAARETALRIGWDGVLARFEAVVRQAVEEARSAPQPVLASLRGRAA
jgi:glycosyltransferase involved in cell wall biosynthesis